MSGQWVEIEFECLPLRSIVRLDVPVDASPKYEQFVLRVKNAMDKHGTLNAYYLHRGRATYHLTNDPARGRITMDFEGTALTDQGDTRTRSLDLTITLAEETCGWLNERIVQFWTETVKHTVLIEFDRYIAAGDLEKTRQRIENLERQSDAANGYLGMYL